MNGTVKRVTEGVLLGAGLAAALAPAASLAQGIGVKPGLWEIEQVFEIPGAPQKGFRNQWQHCVKAEAAQQGPVFANLDDGKGASKKGECKVENLRYPQRGHVTYDIVCGGNTARMQVEYRYTETSFEGKTLMTGSGRTLSQVMKGRYVGACQR